MNPANPLPKTRKGDGMLHPVRPSVSIEREARVRMERELEAMHKSIVYWLTAQWRADTPSTVANDANTTRQLRRTLRQRGRLWRGKFAERAKSISQELTTRTRRHVDNALQGMLRDNDITVKFRMTQDMGQVVEASLGAQVGLITNLAEQHLQQVEGYVMRAIQDGRDLQALTTNLEEGLGISKRRAAFIAQDQTNKTTSTMARTRAMELGCEEAQWLHSAGGKTPRPSHVAYSRQVYSLAKGAYIDGEWIFPGMKPRCRCLSRPILPGMKAKAA